MARTTDEEESFTWESIKLRLLRGLFGNPLATSVHLEHRLPIFLALPVFASDAISSVAYGPQEILLVLASTAVAAGSKISAAGYLIPISLAIAVLMLIVAFSYRRAVHLYPTSGGSYTVAKSNLGPMVGLVAAAALLIDYIMTVAVSISSGVDALTSANTELKPYTVTIALLLVVFITLINLRGTKESGWWFALPLYSFVVMLTLLIFTAMFHYYTGQVHPLPPPENPVQPSPFHLLTLFVILHAFANGCSSMTGVEAVSNGVSAFQPPEPRNAARTLALMVAILVFTFLGVSFAAHAYHVIPADPNQGGVTVLAQLAEVSFGRNILFYLTQYSTLAILMVAANTSFADFPRLLAFVARDNYAPKTFVTQGDRLVFSRGIITLAVISGFLVWFFKANVSALIGLYAVGVFLCFTLSQLGMVQKLRTMRDKNWMQGAAINFIGAIVTGVVTVVVLATKFKDGAWIVAVLIPVIIAICSIIKRHYDWFDRIMTVHPEDFNPLSEPAEPVTVLVLISSDIHRGILEGLECGRAIADGRPDSILRAVHIEMDPAKTPRLKARWEQFVEPHYGHKIRLDIIPSPYRWLIEPIMDYLDWTDLERSGDRVIVVLPEFETGSFITQFLHNFTGRRLRAALLNRPHVTVVSSRFFMKPMAWRLGRAD